MKATVSQVKTVRESNATGRAIALCIALMVTLSGHAQQKDTAVAATADGKGAILVLWAPPDSTIPANGFRIRRTANGQTTTLKESYRPGDDQDAMSRLTPGEQKAVTSFRGTNQPLGLMAASAAANFDFARSLGLALRDTTAPDGPVTYTVENIGTSRAVKRSDPPAAPQPPANLAATVTREAVTINAAKPAKASAETTAVTYVLYRAPVAGTKNEEWTRVSPRPVLPTGELILVDEKPPAVETQFRYAIVSRSVFGIESAPSEAATVFVPDFTALDPPRNVTASASAGSIKVTWEKERNANTAGFIVLRAPNVDGPYTRLTPQPVAAREFVDTTVRGGTANYYQVVAVNKRGEEGGPSLPSVTLAMSKGAPAAPADLTAERKTGRILLRWTGADTTELEGFRVERDAGDGQWSILTSTPSTEPRFDDRLPVGVIGVMKYRVFAVALDGQVSAPSQVVEVPLPRAHAPATPEITAISGQEGRVRIDWRPTGERGEATHFLVLRSTAKNDEGIIVTPTPVAFPAVTFTDTTVTAGSHYYYRVVAYDAAANRSAASEPAAVHVGTPPLPALAPPQLRYETKPYPRVVATFKVPANFAGRVVLERRDRSGKWVAVTAPSVEGATQLVDTRPVMGARNAYRVVSVATNGAVGAASTAVEVDVR